MVGAGHFVDCIHLKHASLNPSIKIEILTPDFRGRMDVALEIMTQAPPDVFNHNLESVPSLYRKIRPGSDYEWSLDLLRKFKQAHPQVPTKSGLMLGLGEEIDEVKQVLARYARTPGQHADPGSVPATQPGSSRGRTLRYARTNSMSLAPTPNQSASTRSPAGRWYAPPTTPTCRPNPSSTPDTTPVGNRRSHLRSLGGLRLPDKSIRF